MAFSVMGGNYDLGLVPNSYVATPVSQTLNTLTTYDTGSNLRFTVLEQENVMLKERVLILEQMVDTLLKRFNRLSFGEALSATP